MAANPEDYRRHALRCVNRASKWTSPTAHQKFADLALAWLMLAVQIEESSARTPRRFWLPYPTSLGSELRKRMHSGPAQPRLKYTRA